MKSVEHDPRSYAALRNPDSRTYLLFAAVAMMADHVEHAISYWMLFVKFHSPSLAGFAVIAHWVPFLVGSVWAGALADRFDPRRIIQVSMGLFIFVSLSWGVLFLNSSLAKWHAVILLIIHGCAGALWAPAGQVLIHSIVGTAQLQSGIRLMATSITLGVLLGPAVGGLLLLFVGPTGGIFINAAIYSPLLIWLVKHPTFSGHVPRRRNPTSSFTELVATVKQIAGIPTVLTMTLLAGLSATFIGNGYQPQLPQFARDFGFDNEGLRYTLLLTANAAGAISAGILLESRITLPSTSRTAILLAMLWCVCIVGFASAHNYIVGITLLFFAGFSDLTFNSIARTLAQLYSPAELRGRAIGLFNVGSLGCRAFSGITIGFGGGFIGIHWSLGLSAMVLFILLGVLYFWSNQIATR